MKEPQSNLSYEEQRLQALYSYDVLGDGLNEELNNLVKLGKQISNAKVCSITFVDRETIISKIIVGFKLNEFVFPRGSSVVASMLSSSTPLFIDDLKRQPDFANSPILKYDPSTTFCAFFPIIDKQGFVLGSLFITDDKPNQLNSKQIEALQTLVDQVVTHLILRRKNKELQLQTERTNEFINIFENSPQIHGVLDKDGNVLYINPAITEITGYTLDEIIGKNLWKFCHQEDVAQNINLLEKGLTKSIKQFNLNFRIICKDKTIKWISWVTLTKGDRWYGYGRDITELKRKDNQLDNLNFVAERINNAVVISDASNRVGWVNEAFTKITGYTLQDAQGKPLGDLLSGPETDWSVIEEARQLINDKKSFAVELLAYHKDGREIWLSIHSSIILNKSGQFETEIEIIIDITEKKKIEQELSVLSTVASKTNTPVIIYNKNWQIVWVNKALCNLTGYREEEMIGNYPANLFAYEETDIKSVTQLQEAARGKRGHNIELSVRKKDYTKMWVSVSNTPILDKDGNIERFVEFITDITERKKFEQDIINAKEQAERLSQAKEMFLSVMSHEMRTPLNAVIGITHLLLENDPKPTQIDDLNILKFSGENLLHIINDVLDFTKIETGNLKLEAIPVNLRTLCHDIISSLQVVALKRQNQLLLYFDNNIPEEVLTDKTRLYQILMNLLSNALKFTKRGKVELSINTVDITSNYTDIQFQIKDTGIGIPDDKLEYIFESFTQASNDTSRKYGGTGLGLAITKKLVKIFGGEIQVESKEGKGSNFHFQLRFKNTSHIKVIQEDKSILFKDKKVLIVDDNKINILIAERILNKWGIETSFVTDGYQAIQAVDETSFDLVFMDIHMPGIDGFETTGLIREGKSDYHKSLPIIALTASTMSDDIYKFKNAGMNGYLFKPFNPSELKKTLIKHLKPV